MDLSQLKPIQAPESPELAAAKGAARRYLQDTDWLVLRQVETGQAVPDDIKAARNAARDTLSAVAADA